MSRLVLCVPNFSEGRDKARVEAIVAAARGVPGVRVLDVETDSDHNRCVLSFIAPAEAALEAAFRSAAKAVELIDLTKHKGEHPRMGAVDVIPFVPLDGDLAECVALAGRLAERVGTQLGVPVYLYDRAARRPERANLANVRKGQFEGLRELIGKDPARDPDFGPKRIHPTAGAVAVGAREQIINFNINLSGLTMEQGAAIAKKVRTSGGGLPHLRAKEIDLAARGLVQISTVLTDYKATPVAKVLDAVRTEAEAVAAEVVGTELIGLVPREALVDFALARLKVENFSKEQVLETRLEALSGGWEAAAERLAAAFASVEPTPGGGSAAGTAGAIGCALGQMAAGISSASKKVDAARREALDSAREGLRSLQGEFHRLTSDDAASFDAVMAALKRPKDDPARADAVQGSLKKAAEVPLETARCAAEALRRVRETSGKAVGTVASDMNCAAHLLRAAALCALENVEINAGSLKDAEAAKTLRAEAA
ncbi:MAG: glutamate formimidoyltransferase, partial [Elusimicrobia bacterium]|nr:glutamate formimidoyltransferase [Elusimicrobiota bacterium]